MKLKTSGHEAEETLNCYEWIDPCLELTQTYRPNEYLNFSNISVLRSATGQYCWIATFEAALTKNSLLGG